VGCVILLIVIAFTLLLWSIAWWLGVIALVTGLLILVSALDES
jgi:hypothetical protein